MNDTTWSGELEDLRRRGLYRTLRTVTGPVAARTSLEGRPVLLLCSNAYLGLHTHPQVVRAAQDAAATYGTGSGASRLVSGNLEIHRQLEEDLARLKGAEDAVVFGTGYQANLGILSAILGPEDVVFSDALNHASLIDACRLSRARTVVYPHGDVEALGRLLRSERASARRQLIVSDGVFSMDGDVAPVPALADLAEDHDAGLLIDDAHGTGVLGSTGAGSIEDAGASGRVPFQMGTLSKALASEGGFVAGSRAFCDLIRNRSRAFIFSTAVSPMAAGAARAAVRLVRAEPERRQRLHSNARNLRAALQRAGYRVPDGRTPILPVMLGAEDAAMSLSARLEAEGVFVGAIRPPTVPPGTSRLRVTVLATHDDSDLALAETAFRRARAVMEVSA